MNRNKRALNEEGRALWDQKAAFWDELHGDQGNRFHRELVSPAVERLLALQPGERVLDIGCGTGVLARRLATLGACVTAVDFSSGLIARARARGQQAGAPIAYAIADATDEQALVSLGEGQFDAVVSTMALMDMPTIQPLYRAARRLLKHDGRLVVATSHPAFNSNNPTFLAELQDCGGTLVTTHALKVTQYLDVPPTRAVGAVGEPASHLFYHRPLRQLLGEAFEAGLLLDGLDEPSFGPEATEQARPLSWSSMPQIPPVLVARFRVAK